MLKEFFLIFSGLPKSTQWALVGGIVFTVFLMRNKLAYYIPAVIGLIFNKKITWEQIKKEKPPEKSEIVIQYLNRVFIRTKVVYDVSSSLNYKDEEEIKTELLALIEKHRGRGELVVIVFAYIETITNKILVSLKFVFDKAIEKNNLIMLIIFPRNLYGNMEELYNYIVDRNIMEGKSSISVKKDCRATDRSPKNE